MSIYEDRASSRHDWDINSWPVTHQAATKDDQKFPWVAADESGATGENLVDQQAIIAHATLKIDDDVAAPLLDDIRRRARITQAPEIKFSHFSKERAARELADIFAPGGPLADRTNIVVAEKRYTAVSKIIDLLIEEWAYAHDIDLYRNGSARRMASTFFKDGPRALREAWEPLLVAFVGLARATQRQGTKEDVPSFYRRLEEARWNCHRRSVEEILILLLETRPYAERLVHDVADRTSSIPSLDPLAALIPLSIHHWYQISGDFRLLHDEHSLFKPEFVQQMLRALWVTHPSLVAVAPKARVALFATGKSSEHPSIQLADLAAGAGRVVVAAHLGRSTPTASILESAFAPLITWGLLPDNSFWER
ncbi:hypothetical protein GCM10023194_40750 [Planotetraspora phitsanulokensis]|uniref:DUF3800 domain-containing protein n=1 Tax=Planotetraspora phitsanulokensis TaxID=575192 RepID=A0A8J3UA18_9ACTN|nr:hypothetical protein [Planotetraspora phitsanulokensis]GII40937.1 hypothetical protein Pph01_59400 [Planotetraspora phitsanulokensis]